MQARTGHPGERRASWASLAAALLAAAPLAVGAMPEFGAGSQDMLRTGGPHAALILDLWRLTLAVCGAVFAAVLAALGLALWRARRGTRDSAPDPQVVLRGEPRLARRVAGAAAVSTVLLFGLIVASVLTDRALAGLPLRDALHVELTAHQWWWLALAPLPWYAAYVDAAVAAGRDALSDQQLGGLIMWVPAGTAYVVAALAIAARCLRPAGARTAASAA